MNAAVPIRYARDNVLFDPRGRTAAIYRLPVFSYKLMTDVQKRSLRDSLAALAFHAHADISVWRVNRQPDVTAYVPQAAGMIDQRYQDPARWLAFLNGHVPQLDLLRSHTPEVYLRVAMKSAKAPGRARGLVRTMDRAYRTVSDQFGVSTDAPLMGSDIDAQMDAEALLFERVRRWFPSAARLTPGEMQWLCRRAPVRHVAEPDTDPWWAPDAMVIDEGDDVAFYPRASSWLPLFNGEVHRGRNYIVTQGDEGVSYQAFLVLGSLPEAVTFPGEGAELMYAPVDLDFAVDACMHAETIKNSKAVAEVTRAIVDARNAIHEATGGIQGPDNRTLDTPELGEDLLEILQSPDRPPMLDGAVSYAIGAPSLQLLEGRVAAFREGFAGVTVHRPAWLQEKLYYQHLLGPAGSIINDWDQMMTLQEFGMLMPVAGRDVGARSGVYFAHTLVGGKPRGPVYADPLAAARDSLPTSIYMPGRQGSGKSFASQLFAYLAAQRGSYVLTADPGPDHYITTLPEFDGESQIIGLRADEAFRGDLDPLTTSPTDLREDLTIGYLLDILPPTHPMRGAWEIEIARSVQAIIERGHGGTLDVLKDLQGGNEHAKGCAHALEPFSKSGLGILAFGDGSKTIGFDSIKRVTTFTMDNLALPPSTTPRADYDRTQRLAVATFKLVGAKMMWLVATDDRSIHKVVILDEAWTWLGTADGRQQLDKLLRKGRKFNTTVIVCSQTVDELGPLAKLIGMYFLFGVNDVEEAQRGLAMIGLDPRNTALATRLADMLDFVKGKCLHRDMFGRVAEIQVDAVFQHIEEGLDTAPRDRRALAGDAA